MADADDFDVEELRRLMMGKAAGPQKPAAPGRGGRADNAAIPAKVPAKVSAKAAAKARGKAPAKGPARAAASAAGGVKPRPARKRP